METYKRAVLTKFGGPNQISVVNSQHPPSPGKGEVLIRIAASSVTATDALIRKGLYPLLKKKPPFTLGYAFAGKVEAVGVSVSTRWVGRQVADISQIGGNATHICRPAADLLSVASELKGELVASLVLSGMTAYQLFKRYLKVKSGDHVLVHGGSGAVGSTLLQLCKTQGIRTVTTASSRKHAAIEAYADILLDYQSPTYLEALKTAAADGFDAIVDFTSLASFDRSFKLLKRGGRFVNIGVQQVGKKAQRKNTRTFLAFGLSFARMMMKLTWWHALPNGRSAHFFGIVSSKKQFRTDTNKISTNCVDW